jgi:DNA-directed RNA polymerase specialized sigma24 family protein
MASEAGDRALALHQRLLASDPTASAELFETMLGSVEAHLVKRHSSALDREALRDIAVDALMSYVLSPEKFDPSKAGLYRYLTLIADGDVRDAIRSRSRQPRKLEPLVEDHRPPANSLAESEERLIPLNMEMRTDAMAVLKRYQHDICTDPGDADVLALILKDEKESAAFARALGLDDPEDAEARKTVLQVKDKITRRLRRLKDKLANDRY